MLDIHRAHFKMFMIDGSKLKLMSHFFNFENLQQNVILRQQPESGSVNVICVTTQTSNYVCMDIW